MRTRVLAIVAALFAVALTSTTAAEAGWRRSYHDRYYAADPYRYRYEPRRWYPASGGTLYVADTPLQHGTLDTWQETAPGHYEFRLRAGPNGRTARTLPLNISLPRGCDLKDRTAAERMIGERYLRRWGLVHEV